MKALISVLAVSLASSAIASGSNIEPRIINGTDASLSDWPFLVSLRNSSGDHVWPRRIRKL